MTSTTLVKQADNPSPAQQMSYVEALQVIEKQNRKIKEAARHRIHELDEPEDVLYGRNLVKSFSTAGLITACAVTTGFSGALDTTSASLLSFGTFIGGTIGSIVFSGTSWFSRLISPMKYRKLLAEYLAHENLRKLKESEYKRIETKALKKASTAIEVANRTLASKSKEIDYCPKIGREGFSVVDVTNSGEIAQEMLRAISESEKSDFPVPDATKAITGMHMKELEPSF